MINSFAKALQEDKELHSKVT